MSVAVWLTKIVAVQVNNGSVGDGESVMVREGVNVGVAIEYRQSSSTSWTLGSSSGL